MGGVFSCFFSDEKHQKKPKEAYSSSSQNGIASTVNPNATATPGAPSAASKAASPALLQAEASSDPPSRHSSNNMPKQRQHSKVAKELGIEPVEPTSTESYLSSFWNDFVEGRTIGNGLSQPRGPISGGRWDHTASRKAARKSESDKSLATEQEIIKVLSCTEPLSSPLSTALSSIHSSPRHALLNKQTSGNGRHAAAYGKTEDQPTVFQNPSFESSGAGESFELPSLAMAPQRTTSGDAVRSPFVWDSRDEMLAASRQLTWSDWKELQIERAASYVQNGTSEAEMNRFGQSWASSYMSEDDILATGISSRQLLTKGRAGSSTHPPEEGSRASNDPLRRSMEHEHTGTSSSVQHQLEDYELLGPLSHHSTTLDTLTGTTKLMRHRMTGELVAAKFIKLKGQGVMHKYAEREVVNHRQLVHRNIVRVKDVFLTADRTALTIITEYATCGNMGLKLARQKRLSEAETRRLSKQLVWGLKYCHSKAIYHRNLHPDCLLLDGDEERPTLKIGGFSRSKSGRVDSGLKTQVSKAIWSAPELLMGSYQAGEQEATYDGSCVDIWALGLILWACLWGGSPFQHAKTSAIQAMGRIVKGQFIIPQEPQVSEPAKDLVRRILVAKPEHRITLPEVAKHPWLTQQVQPAGGQVVQATLASMDLATMEAVTRSRRRRRSSHQIHHGLPDY